MLWRALAIVVLVGWSSVARADDAGSLVIVVDRALPAAKLAIVHDALAGARDKLDRVAASRAPAPQKSVAAILVIDRSGSMSGNKLETAKAAARAVVESLSPDDTVAVVAVDRAAAVIIPVQRAANRLAITTEVARLAG